VWLGAQPVENSVNDDGSEHYQPKARIPIAGQVKKSDDLSGLRHSTDSKSQGKDYSSHI
jgi:hypothetical protein